MDEGVRSIVTWSVVVGTAGATIATGYLWKVWWSSQIRAALYLIIAMTASTATMGLLLVLIPAVIAVRGAERLPAEFTLVLLGLGLLASAAMPITFALYVYYVRHKKVNVVDPSQHDDDPVP